MAERQKELRRRRHREEQRRKAIEKEGRLKRKPVAKPLAKDEKK